MVLLSLVLAAGCVAEVQDDDAEAVVGAESSSLTSSQRRVRAAQIRDAAAGNGIRAGWLFAGIADAETQMSHCWSELTWACQGPYSADCGGPVVAGAGDGPCRLREGGLGMFQFDAGTFDDTLRREGNRVLSISGNVDAAVDFVVDMVIRSRYIAGVSTYAQAIDWMNGVTPTNARFDPWVRTVTHYYNGCQPNFSCFNQRYRHYRDNALGVYNEMGASFWNVDGSAGPIGPSFLAIEVYWNRRADGAYDLRALGPEPIERVVYRVDDHEIGSATLDDGFNYPAEYAFSSENNERRFEVWGYDESDQLIGVGHGLIDVTDGVGVYVRQLGAGLYEIGLERAPAAVAAIDVEVDGRWTLTDAVSGTRRSRRNAVRSTFSNFGTRDFAINTYNKDGSYRGTLHRRFNIR